MGSSADPRGGAFSEEWSAGGPGRRRLCFPAVGHVSSSCPILCSRGGRAPKRALIKTLGSSRRKGSSVRRMRQVFRPAGSPHGPLQERAPRGESVAEVSAEGARRRPGAARAQAGGGAGPRGPGTGPGGQGGPGGAWRGDSGQWGLPGSPRSGVRSTPGTLPSSGTREHASPRRRGAWARAGLGEAELPTPPARTPSRSCLSSPHPPDGHSGPQELLFMSIILFKLCH